MPRRFGWSPEAGLPPWFLAFAPIGPLQVARSRPRITPSLASTLPTGRIRLAPKLPSTT